MKRSICMLAVTLLLASIPAGTQDKGDSSGVMTDGYTNCRAWNNFSLVVKIMYVTGYKEGTAAGIAVSVGTVDKWYQTSPLLWPRGLNGGEVVGRLNTYCSTHEPDQLIVAIKQIANDVNKP